ncbi:OmpA family protein [Mucilaginibacter myungsuensis]|uniref:OmpA family protein n=1 Tax=Mucilaginibacter myungsuensis TaxID=649104 RepID=A0A929KZ88_9SPHI|nr:OmpA family protein [Mucilaginibacter myungsuensis]MBE9663280.1 OmpA family protein [Mucilaginibacter myungsuensis]MDN3600015.1 OmpA family protein [Mucilaginibacter myungsuensis]
MKTIRLKAATFGIAIATTALLGMGCNSFTKTQKGAAIGAGAGGVVGAFVGKAAGNTALGAIIGGAVGGTAGALIGKNMDKQAAEIKNTVPGATVIRQGEGILVKFDSGILFDVDKTGLKDAAKSNLQNLAKSLEANPQTNITIVGHTDDTGSDSHNMDLSIRRAEAVKAYIVSGGVATSRLTTNGKGESEPIADNTTADGRVQNRRVEIAIVANDQMKSTAKASGN